MKLNQLLVLVSHRFNGNADFIEVDGQKFIPDETDPTKAKLGADGKPTPYVGKKVDPALPKIDDLSTADLEALAKVNPKVAKMLADNVDSQKRESDRIAAEDEAKRKDAEKNGEWQKLAESERVKRETAEKELAQKNEILGKYVGSIETILKEVLATIPEANRGLIPEKFSPREKLEYITANAKLLGAKIVGGTGTIPKNDATPNGTDEDKMVARLQVLIALGNKRTSTENQELRELGTKVTELRKAKEAASKVK